MSINERARARIELDGQQAEAQLESLRAKAAAMRKELNQMRLSKDPGYPYQATIDQLTQSYAKIVFVMSFI